MNDTLILVDPLDRPVGFASKEEAHRTPLLHRAFSVFLTDGDRMLLQRRARGKYHSGGLWTNACCSHPRKGETLEEAVHRRLLEELGADVPLTEAGSFQYYHRFSPELCEFEYDHVFHGTCRSPLTPDPAEVEAIRWVDMDTLKQEMLTRPDQFTVWFMTAAPMLFRYLSERENASR